MKKAYNSTAYGHSYVFDNAHKNSAARYRLPGLENLSNQPGKTKPQEQPPRKKITTPNSH